jgi:hypothetical protein
MMLRLLIVIVFALLVLTGATAQTTYLPVVELAPARLPGCQIATATPTRAGWPVTTPPICSYDAYDCSDFASPREATDIWQQCAAQCMGDIHQLDPDKDGLACFETPR